MFNKKHAFAAILAYAACAAQAADYYVVVPVKSRSGAVTVPPTSPTPDPAAAPIVVTLNAMALPNGKVGVAYAGLNFDSILQVFGDPTFTGAGVRWSVTQGSLPAGLSLDAASGVLAGTPTTAVSGQQFQVTATYKEKSGSQSYAVSISYGDPRSCQDYLMSNPAAPSGWYALDVDGSGPTAQQNYYCDMVSDGGGWTRIVRQTEAQPVKNWTGAVNGASYTLAPSSIPTHTQVAFGKDDAATALDYVDWTYTTGDIPKTLVTSPKTGVSYHLYRSVGGRYYAADPENYYITADPEYNNNLTFNKAGATEHTWAFLPGATDSKMRGYAYRGSRYGYADTMAWTVWVR